MLNELTRTAVVVLIFTLGTTACTPDTMDRSMISTSESSYLNSVTSVSASDQKKLKVGKAHCRNWRTAIINGDGIIMLESYVLESNGFGREDVVIVDAASKFICAGSRERAMEMYSKTPRYYDNGDLEVDPGSDQNWGPNG